MRKIYITIFTLVVLMISMTASVFAWFYEKTETTVLGAGGVVMSAGKTEVNEAIDFKFESPEFDYLIYIDNNDLKDDSTTQLKNLATSIKVELTNTSDKNVTAQIFPELLPAEVTYLSGVIEGLKYVTYLEGSAYSRNDVKNNNAPTFNIPAGDSIIICMDFWAYYDGLAGKEVILPGQTAPTSLQKIYYALIYYVSINLKAQG